MGCGYLFLVRRGRLKHSVADIATCLGFTGQGTGSGSPILTITHPKTTQEFHKEEKRWICEASHAPFIDIAGCNQISEAVSVGFISRKRDIRGTLKG